MPSSYICSHTLRTSYKKDLDYFTTRVQDTSVTQGDTSYTSMTRVQHQNHKEDKSNTSAT